MNTIKKAIRMATSGLTLSALAGASAAADCGIPGNVVNALQNQLAIVATTLNGNGGIFNPNRMWSAVVDRKGVLCSVVKVGDAWPGSRAIAIAKASTANDFSNDGLSLSTANLYSATQPGGSLYGLNNSNPFNPEYLQQDSGLGKVPGGVITFGGGVALYSNGKVIGGLGVSGDSACADHVIAYRMRKATVLDRIPQGVGFNGTDDIDYLAVGAPPAGFKHPHCSDHDFAPGTY
jgi:uncharacterized protein GlcG (DUF336 family)